MSRKAAILFEESKDPTASPQRRSTRSRKNIASSPSPASRVGSHSRRNSISQEIDLEGIGEVKESNEVLTPVQRIRRGSFSNLHEDENTTPARAGSPVIHSVSDRRRSLRSASRSPTSSASDSMTNPTSSITNGTPSKLRGRRASAEKNPPKRLGSVALERLDELNEADSPKKKMFKKAAPQPVGEEIATEDDDEKHTKEITDYERTPTPKVEIEPPKTLTDDKPLSEKVQFFEQFLEPSKIVLTPLTKRVSSEKLSEMVDDESLNETEKEITDTKETPTPKIDVDPPKITTDKKSLYEQVGRQFLDKPKVVVSSLTQRASSEKLSEMVDDESLKEIAYSEETPNLTSKITKISLNEKVLQQFFGKSKVILSPLTKIISSETLSEMIYDAISANSKEFKKAGDASEESVASLNADIVPLNKSIGEFKLSPKRTSLNLSSSAIISPRLITEADSVDDLDSPVRKVDNVNSSSEDKTKTFNSPRSKKKPNFDESKEIVDGSDGSFNYFLKPSLLSSHEEGLNKSTSKIDAKLINNESGEENVPSVTIPDINKRVSNVFSSKNAEESFLEEMEVEYPTDNDESLSVLHHDRTSMNTNKSSVAPTDIVVASDGSNCGSLHFICSEEKKLTTETKPAAKHCTKNCQSVALIQLDLSLVDDGAFNSLNIVPARVSTIFESRLTILPDKVLTPLKDTTIASEAKESVSEDLHKTFQYSDDEDTSKLSSSTHSIGASTEEELNSTADESSEASDVEQEDSAKLVESIRADLNQDAEEEIDSSSSSEYEDTTSKKPKGCQRITIVSSGSSESSDSQSKLIQDKFDEGEELSDDESTSEDSNEISDVGENIALTDDEEVEETELEQASGSDVEFINDYEDLRDDNGKVTLRKKGRISIRSVDEMAKVEIPSVTKAFSPNNLETSNKRKSSINVQENIKAGEVNNTTITDKIGDIVDVFCSSFSESKTGNVTVHVSLHYDESSNDEKSHKVNKSLMCKSTYNVKASCASSSKIKIADDLEMDNNKSGQEPIKKSTKKKSKHNVFLPESSSHDKSKKILLTPKPSNISALPENVMQLGSEEQTTSKPNVNNKKYGFKKNNLYPWFRVPELYCKLSRQGSTDNFTVTKLVRDVKTSKCNANSI